MNKPYLSVNLKGSLLANGAVDKKLGKTKKLLMSNQKSKYVNHNILLKQKFIFGRKNNRNNNTSEQLTEQSTDLFENSKNDVPIALQNPDLQKYFLEQLNSDLLHISPKNTNNSILGNILNEMSKKNDHEKENFSAKNIDLIKNSRSSSSSSISRMNKANEAFSDNKIFKDYSKKETRMQKAINRSKIGSAASRLSKQCKNINKEPQSFETIQNSLKRPKSFLQKLNSNIINRSYRVVSNKDPQTPNSNNSENKEIEKAKNSYIDHVLKDSLSKIEKKNKDSLFKSNYSLKLQLVIINFLYHEIYFLDVLFFKIVFFE